MGLIQCFERSRLREILLSSFVYALRSAFEIEQDEDACTGELVEIFSCYSMTMGGSDVLTRATPAAPSTTFSVNVILTITHPQELEKT
jgi:hypothetical protein